MADMGTKRATEKWGITQAIVSKCCRNNLITGATQDKKGSMWHITPKCKTINKEKKIIMLKKIEIMFFVIIAVLCMAGCNNETEEERLHREIKESEQKVKESIKEYNDTQRSVNKYNKYRNAVENAK